MSTVTRAKLMRGDFALYDGKTPTYKRRDATGGTVQGLRVNDYVDVLQVYGEGTNRTSATMNDTIRILGSSVATLIFGPGTWVISENVTIPSTLSVIVKGGCVFNIASGRALTFSGPVHVEYSASDGTGWYTGSGTISCSQGATGFPGW